MKTMKAAVIREFGGPEVLKIEEVPVPEPKDDEVLVRVHAASINPIDYKIRSGSFGMKQDALPMILGRDLSGVVTACGPAAKTLSEGDALYAFLGGVRGSYAEFVLVKPNEYASKPERLSHAEAAAVPLAGLTAWQGLFDQGGLREGQRVLIHGGAGGVGHFAVQFAKARGAIVAATAAEEDLIFVRNLGADQVIDYKNQRFEDEVEKVDLVFDLIAGETQNRSFAVLKPGGILVSTLKQPDEEKLREYKVRGTHYMAKPDSKELAAIGDLIAQGKVRPAVSAAYPFAEVAEAQRQLEKGHVRGKIVILMQS